MSGETACDRLREARQRRGLTPEEVATHVGISVPSYYDLETHPDEIFSAVSLADLQVLGDTLRVER